MSSLTPYFNYKCHVEFGVQGLEATGKLSTVLGLLKGWVEDYGLCEFQFFLEDESKEEEVLGFILQELKDHQQSAQGN